MLLIALALGARLSGSITRPIVQLIQNMRKIEKGDLDRLEEEHSVRFPSPHRMRLACCIERIKR
ncbi:nitrogen fixation/metabolism regulation signal transduction histidine kinase [Paenibacillus brasilensis]|uniref:Nitrogen fixation/metabolism regulation signal transduction histidine kinase n=1 Tax=Paenibacillus brasilensis TaxID=128574 RepID=A0ABU0L2X4_9BACL|nr:nitrogen fixation/metabolism regulation signal transduction histidine kinase [Paenibacillus brasilensis]